MFDLKRPCVNCPFRTGQGERFQLNEFRLEAIRRAPAFQCHKTVDYDSDIDGEGEGLPGDKPQQCAGLMAVLHRIGEPNQIMRVAMRLNTLDPETLDPAREAYDSWAEVRRAHRCRNFPAEDI